MTSATRLDRQVADAMLGAVAAALGVALDWDENDQCGLAFDRDVDVVLALSPRDDVLALHARVSPPGPAPSMASLRQALAMNGGRLPLGMALSMDAHAEQLRVEARIPVLDVEPVAVVALLADLVALVPDVRAELALAGDAAQARPDEPLALAAAFRGALRI